MSIEDGKNVMVRGCTVLWDAMTSPDTNESGLKHSFKVAVPPNNPDIAQFEQLTFQTLAESDFKGVLPNGGTMSVGTLGPNEYDGMYNGWRVFTAGTYRGFPDCYNENGDALDPMQAGPQIYPGQMVNLMVHCYVNNGKVKGIAAGLDGFCCVLSANAPRMNYGGGPRADTAGAFGAGGGQPAYQAPAQQPAQQFDPATGQPITQPPVYQAPAQQPAQQFDPATGQPITQPPTQAHNFMPK